MIRMLEQAKPKIAWSKEMEMRNQIMMLVWKFGLNSVAIKALVRVCHWWGDTG